MTGFGTILNSAGIVFGGIIGRFAGKFLKPRRQDALNTVYRHRRGHDNIRYWLVDVKCM